MIIVMTRRLARQRRYQASRNLSSQAGSQSRLPRTDTALEEPDRQGAR
jgi:hypothetical protein